MLETTVTTKNFEDEVLKAEDTVLVDFWATWCPPCRKQAPVLVEFAIAHPEIKVCKVNTDEEPALAQRFAIEAIPTLMIFKNGVAVKQEAGYKDIHQLEAFAL
ncbi:MAG: thioredoxin [Coriobacteriales bacterium]|nr:thioredoxin [Coriobacteriales bacterium]MBQ6586151.1 thioredoxin [Coriobacteriales bacterium]